MMNIAHNTLKFAIDKNISFQTMLCTSILMMVLIFIAGCEQNEGNGSTSTELRATPATQASSEPSSEQASEDDSVVDMFDDLKDCNSSSFDEGTFCSCEGYSVQWDWGWGDCSCGGGTTCRNSSWTSSSGCYGCPSDDFEVNYKLYNKCRTVTREDEGLPCDCPAIEIYADAQWGDCVCPGSMYCSDGIWTLYSSTCTGHCYSTDYVTNQYYFSPDVIISCEELQVLIQDYAANKQCNKDGYCRLVGSPTSTCECHPTYTGGGLAVNFKVKPALDFLLAQAQTNCADLMPLVCDVAASENLRCEEGQCVVDEVSCP